MKVQETPVAAMCQLDLHLMLIAEWMLTTTVLVPLRLQVWTQPAHTSTPMRIPGTIHTTPHYTKIDPAPVRLVKRRPMPKPTRVKWTPQQDSALERGHQKHANNEDLWVRIHSDREFVGICGNLTPQQIKDRWVLICRADDFRM